MIWMRLQVQEDVSKSLSVMKNILYGNHRNDTQAEMQVSEFFQCATNAFEKGLNCTLH